MGFYLNSLTAYALYKSETVKPYFVDKSKLLEELFPLVLEGNSHICITRPRRFGKTVMANMVASFFSRACDTGEVFESLNIAQTEDYRKHINSYPVIHISFNSLPKRCKSYTDYIDRIERKLVKDLREEYPDMDIDENEAVWDILTGIYERDASARFIFVLDEWDFIFHRDFVTEGDKREYTLFLSSLLKDKPYVLFTYMTGILPIAKYSSGSELNMFVEFTMVTEEKFSDYFGFTESEADSLYQRYLEKEKRSRITREELRVWYDGYHTFSGERVYNPRSVVVALSNNNTGNYWTSSGPYDEIFYYIERNVADVREDLVLMVSGESVPAQIREYAATSMNLQTKDEIFSAMVVYGFLSYESGRVTIPNKELMDRFVDMFLKETSLGYIHRLAKESIRMLNATLIGDTATMTEILEYVHDTEAPLLSYNNETELTAVVNLVYLAARDTYRVEREEKVGIGYVDFIFYPEADRSADGIILELKVNHTPEEAIQQIKDKKYALKFWRNMGAQSPYTGRVLAVGISYNKDSKKHSCKIEVL